MKRKGILIISLDFELIWGVFDLVNLDEKRKYFENTRKVIPEILEMFRKYRIHATWATVGMLMNKNWEEWNQNLPEHLPTYTNPAVSAYAFGRKIQSSDCHDLCFAPEIIDQISLTPGQEIATHTYSHYYCLEEGQNEVQFRADLQQAIKVAGRRDIILKSLVFPRNQFRAEYLEICKELGITSVRSNPSSWYWNDVGAEKLYSRMARTGDAYLALGKKSYSINEIYQQTNLPIKQKASRFLRATEGKLLRRIKIDRVKAEMTRAAKRNEIYHLWWHPHNFGDKPVKSLYDLQEILEHFEVCKKLYGFKSKNMEELVGQKIIIH